MNRKDINKVINFLFLSKSEIIGSPKKSCTTFELVRTDTEQGEIKYQNIEDIASVSVDLPVFFNTHFLMEQHPVFLATLKQGRVWGRNGAVISSGDHFLTDVSREFNNGLNVDHSVFYTIKQKKCKVYDSKVAVIGTADANIYYHWMMDILPRIGLISRNYSLDEIDYFVTEFTSLPFQIETLKKVGIQLSKIIASNENWNFHIKCKELILPSLASPMDQATIFQVEYLRMIYKDCIKKQIPKQRIYISRKKTGRRMIVNEPELLDFLSRYDFTIVYSEDLSVAEQVELFSRSAVIVCSHGSALTNLVFCNPGTTIVDIFNDTHINPCFWFISKINDLNYQYFSAVSEPIDDNSKNDNTFVNMDNFKKYFSGLSIS